MRYERINIGVILGSKVEGTIMYQLLPSNNKKLKFFLWNQLEKKQYAATIDLLSYLLDNLKKHPSIFSEPTNSNSSWAEWLGSNIPDTILFSRVHVARSSNPNLIFNSLIETYVGSQFLNVDVNASPLKISVHNFFEERNLLENKLKTNIKVQPSKSLPFKVEMDYVFLKEPNSDPNFLTLTPKKGSIVDWYKNNATLLNKSSSYFNLNLIVNQKDYESKDNKLAPLVNDLCSDNKVKPIFIDDISNSPELDNLAENIQDSLDTANWSTKNILIA